MKRRRRSSRKTRGGTVFLVGAAALFLLAGFAIMADRDAPFAHDVEELAEEHELAFADMPESLENFKALMAEYFACRAFAAESPKPCRLIDPWATAAPSPETDFAHSPPCRRLYFEATALKELLTGNEEFPEACLAYARLDRDPEADEPGAEFEDCRDFAEFVRKGDPSGFCRLEPAGLERRLCRMEFAYLGGRTSLCRRNKEPMLRRRCEEKAELIRAVQENQPQRVASTIYAPLLGGDSAVCEAFGEKILALYAEESRRSAKR